MAVLSKGSESTWVTPVSDDHVRNSYSISQTKKTARRPEKADLSPAALEVEQDTDEVNDSTDTAQGTSRTPNHAAIARRVAIAQRLSALALKAAQSVGKLKLSADLQVLRRELASVRPELRRLQTERDYLSIITLVEGGLENTNWKQMTKQQLEQFSTSLAIGTSSQPLCYDMVIRQMKGLRARGVQTLAVFDIHDGEEKDTDEALDCLE